MTLVQAAEVESARGHAVRPRAVVFGSQSDLAHVPPRVERAAGRSRQAYAWASQRATAYLRNSTPSCLRSPRFVELRPLLGKSALIVVAEEVVDDPAHGLSRDTPSPSIDLTAFTGPRRLAQIPAAGGSARDLLLSSDLALSECSAYHPLQALTTIIKVLLSRRGESCERAIKEQYVRYTKPHHLRVMGLGTHHEQMLTIFGVRLGKHGLVPQGLRPRKM